MDDYEYPVTIVSDRYNGSYSGAKFLAFLAHPSRIPEEIGSCDVSEMSFWGGDGHTKWKIGKGFNPQEAYEDLLGKIKT